MTDAARRPSPTPGPTTAPGVSVADLPLGDHPQPLALPHFPTRQQAFVWRNWELVPPARLARVLGTRTAQVVALARGLGLRVPARVGSDWLDNGYCTLIRANWHLLPYDQLLALLGWTPERLDFTLREDDFLWVKLGQRKPAAAPLRYRALTKAEQRATRRLRADVARHFPAGARGRGTEAPFAFLEAMRQTPADLPRRATAGTAAELRLAYSFSATYGDTLLHPGRDPYPDGMLARYAALGVNAIWLQGVLYTLAPWDAFPELSAGWRTRLANLRALVQRAARFGIGVYLYWNEPRPLPLACFAAHPEREPQLKGTEFPQSGIANLCTSLPGVQRFLREGAEHVFREVPDLAGVFTITMNENPSNCCSRWISRTTCPRCSKRRPAEVIAEVNRLLADGVRAAKPEARVIAWTWGWDPEWDLEAVDRLPEGVDVMCVSEWGLPTRVGGVAHSVVDYSISQVGPSEQSVRLWRRARARGLRAIAKVQINNSWENSSVPYLPVPDLVERHLARLRREGISGLMLGWTLGGYPGGNLPLVDRPSSELAEELVGSRAAPLVRRAWSAFSRAFTQLPFDSAVLYHSPLNVGPANLLHATATGFTATMVMGFPYDDLKGWRGCYPEAVFERQLRRLSDGWQRGLRLLAAARRLVPRAKHPALDEIERMAWACYCHFRSTGLQVRFVRARDAWRAGAAPSAAMRAILAEEIALAKILHRHASRDSRLGFEAANHYAYTLNDLREKVIACAWLRRQPASAGA